MKTELNQDIQNALTAVGARETQTHLDLMRLDDAKEGMRAFMERRPPRWTGGRPSGR